MNTELKLFLKNVLKESYLSENCLFIKDFEDFEKLGSHLIEEFL